MAKFKLQHLFVLVTIVCVAMVVAKYLNGPLTLFLILILGLPAVYMVFARNRAMIIYSALAGIIVGTVFGEVMASKIVSNIPPKGVIFNAFGNEEYVRRSVVERRLRSVAHSQGILLGVITGTSIGLLLASRSHNRTEDNNAVHRNTHSRGN